MGGAGEELNLSNQMEELNRASNGNACWMAVLNLCLATTRPTLPRPLPRLRDALP